MPTYKYKVRDKQGKVLEGALEAENPKDLRQKLDAKGYFVVEFSEKKSLLSAGNMDILLPFKRVSYTDISVFSWQLYTMLEAGMPLVQSLRIIYTQTKNPKLKTAIDKIRVDVEEGTGFSAALAKHSAIFSSLYVHMIEAGEVGGVMDEMIKRLAIFYERQAQIRSEIQLAMAYPVLLGIICLSVIVFLVSFVIPKFVGMFANMGIVLPVPTQVLLIIGSVMKSYYPYIIAGSFIVIILFNIYIRSSGGRFLFDKLKLSLPLFGKLVNKTTVSKFSQTLSILVTSGIPILTALDVVKDSVDNMVLTKALVKVSADVKEGEALAGCLNKTKMFPDMVVNMVRVGEETGALDKMLEKVALFYDREVDGAIKLFTKMIEPVMIVFMTVVVGFIAISIFLPMTDIMSGISRR